MRFADASIVFRKEMTDLLRDRRSILAMIVFPILLQPVFLFGGAKFVEFGERRLDRIPIRVSAMGGLGDLRERIYADSLIRPVTAEDPREAVRAGVVEAAILLPPALGDPGSPAPEATILFDESRDLSRDAKRRLEMIVDEWRRERRDARLDSLGVPRPDALLPIRMTNLASEEKMTGGKLAKLIPVILVFLLMNGASFAAVDLFAGERERKTIETLLTSRADRPAVVVGKFVAVFVAALTATVLFLISSLVMTRLGWIGPGGAAGGAMAVSPLSAAVVLLISLPLAFLLSALLVLMASHARSYREAQTLLLPAMLIGILPAAVAMAPGIHFGPFLSLLPVLNVGLAVRDAFLESYPALPLALTFLSNTLYALLLLRSANRYLTGERVILGAGGGRGGASAFGEAGGALVFYASMILGLYYFGSLVQTWKLLPGLLITLWGFLLVPTLLYARARGLTRRDLHLRAAKGREILAGFLLAPPALLAAHLLFQVQSRFLPVPEGLLESLSKMMDGGAHHPAFLLFAVAISPAICEELLFRGLLLGRFRRVMSPLRAVLLSGFLFGLFHLSIYRILPTALLGAATGALVIRSGSILPAMALHFLYNGVVILASRFHWIDRIESFSGVWILVSSGCALVSVLLLRLGGGRKR